MCRSNSTTRIGWKALAVLLTMLSGCQQLKLPAIDPTGERVFSDTDAMRMATISDSRCRGTCFTPKPAWEQPISPEPCPEPPPPAPPGVYAPAAEPEAPPRRPEKGVPGQIMLSPVRMIAPVGSEVVIVGGLCGEDGYLITQQPVEFMLSQDSVGQFVEVSDQQRLWCPSKKLSADYAIARTTTRSQVVTRGTPSVTDDIVQQKGQCWVSLTSASEGTSYVTAVASKGATWPQRRKSATIYWVDAKWAFPNPVSVPAGQPYTLSTNVQRTATGAPVVGFIVRYELTDGVPAVFGPGGAAAIETRTDEEGLANVQLQPTTNQPGVSQIRIQVIRPADPNSDAPRTVLGEGFTSITWSAPGLTLRATGPQSGTVDSTLVYRLEIHNPGDIPTRDIVVRDVLPPSLKYISSNPSAQVFGNRAEWRIAEIPARGVQVIEVTLLANAAGSVRYSFQATSADGLQGEAHVDTLITRPALSLNVVAPDTAVAGEQVTYRIEVTNNGERTLDNVTISDRFDAGLRHADGLTSPIQKLLGRLEPGQTKVFAVTFQVQRSGQVCHVLEVTAPGGEYAQKQVCLTASEPEVTPVPRLQVTKTVVPESPAGGTVQFTIQVTNTGNVPLTNVRTVDTYDRQLQMKEATPGWDPAAWESGQLMWITAQLNPGQSVQYGVLCECVQVAEAATGRVTVTADQGISEVAQASVRITPAAQLQPGVDESAAAQQAGGPLRVDISEFSDPIPLGEKTSYVIRIKNDRQVPDQDVVLKLEFPPGLQFRSIAGPGQQRTVSPDNRVVQISPIKEMRAGETLPPFKVEATGSQVGDQELKVTVTSRLSPQGVVARETTTVYSQ